MNTTNAPSVRTVETGAVREGQEQAGGAGGAVVRRRLVCVDLRDHHQRQDENNADEFTRTWGEFHP